VAGLLFVGSLARLHVELLTPSSALAYFVQVYPVGKAQSTTVEISSLPRGNQINVAHVAFRFVSFSLVSTAHSIRTCLLPVRWV
jgi:hypothetical protein